MSMGVRVRYAGFSEVATLLERPHEGFRHVVDMVVSHAGVPQPSLCQKGFVYWNIELISIHMGHVEDESIHIFWFVCTSDSGSSVVMLRLNSSGQVKGFDMQLTWL